MNGTDVCALLYRSPCATRYEVLRDTGMIEADNVQHVFAGFNKNWLVTADTAVARLKAFCCVVARQQRQQQ